MFVQQCASVDQHHAPNTTISLADHEGERMQQLRKDGHCPGVTTRESVTSQERDPMAAQIAVSGSAVFAEREEEVAGS